MPGEGTVGLPTEESVGVGQIEFAPSTTVVGTGAKAGALQALAEAQAEVKERLGTPNSAMVEGEFFPFAGFSGFRAEMNQYGELELALIYRLRSQDEAGEVISRVHKHARKGVSSAE